MTYQTAAAQIERAGRIVVLTGAGVSTASGIPDFRSSEGLWTEDYSREYYMSNDYFQRHPEDFWKKYKDIFRLKLLQDYRPNKVHQFIHELETVNRQVSVITQNVDGLHQLAGSTSVLEYHGTLNQSFCQDCGRAYPLEDVMQAVVPVCRDCRTTLKPGVMLFGDLITAHDEAEKMVTDADLLLVMGTSLQVTPFSLLPYYAWEQGTAASILINNEPTDKDHLFDTVLHDDLSHAVQQLQKYL